MIDKNIHYSKPTYEQVGTRIINNFHHSEVLTDAVSLFGKQ